MIFIYNLSSISARSAEVPPSLVTDLSKKVISINVSFSGSKFHIFGAIKKYASQIKNFHVLPVYGGQEYRRQIRGLQRGVHVVVGTPGRVMDHMRRGTLKLEKLNTLVLDEADEMLRMGFIDDVEWILEKTPPKRQIALFSATMPKQIRSIARRYLRDPEQIIIKVKTTTAKTIRQRFWQ